MKKKILAKKTLSVFLAVLMLMSAWVFVPGEHNHAEAADAVSATEAYNKVLLNGINPSIDTTMPTVIGKFKDPNMEGDEHDTYNTATYGSQHYHNIFYSPTVTSSEPAAKMTGIPNVDSVMVYYPETVMIYDGITTPRMGVVACLDGGTYRVRSESVYLSSGANGLVITDIWKGKTTGNLAHIINMHNGNYQFNCVLSGETGYNSTYVINTDANGEWYFYASDMTFDGSNMGAAEFVRTITPTWGFYGTYYQKKTFSSTTGTMTKYTDVADKNIYVMNVKAYKDILTTISNDKATYLSKAGQYTTESIRAYVNAANAILNLNPKNVAQNVSAVTTWGTNMTNAYNAYNTAKNGLKNRNHDITYENIFSISDWANSESFAADGTNFVLENGNTVKIYKSATGGELVTSSSYSGDHKDTMYSMPVTGGKKYTVRFNVTSSVSGTPDSEVFFFWYDDNNKPVTNVEGTGTLNNAGFSSNGIHSATFTAPANATKAEIRFDNNCLSSGSTLRFSDIAVYPEDRGTEYEIDSWTTRPVTKQFAYNATLSGNLDVPARKGYTFNGWYNDANGNGSAEEEERITDANGTVIKSLTMNQAYNLHADWKPLLRDIGYDNLFSLVDWSLTGSVRPSQVNGTIEYDVTAGTITATSISGGEVYSTYNADGYTMDVKPNTEYVFTAKMTTPAASVQKYGQMFIFCYDANGSSVNGPTELKNDGTENTLSGQSHIGIYPATDGVHTIKFRTPADCYKLRIRVGATADGVIETYSDIGVFEKEAYDAYAKDYAIVRQAFTPGEVTDLTLKPTREGYEFDGWYKADGTKLTSVAGLEKSETVYAHWIQKFTVTFKNYNGDILKTEYVAPGNSATAPADPSKIPDDNYEYAFDDWDKDFSNVTSDLVVTATFTPKAHENVSTYPADEADCVNPGTVTKHCEDCGHDFNNGNPIEVGTALGHRYAAVVEGSSTGDGYDDVHTLKCNRPNCPGGADATITEVHKFIDDENNGATTATCTVAGKTFKICSVCHQSKTIEGAIDPDNHVNTELRGVVAAECEKPGYTGDTYCKDCKQTVAFGEEIDPLVHTYTKYTYNEGTATCFNNGTETAYCDNGCGTTDTREAANSKLTHKYTNYIYNEGTAKCEVNGTETATCDHGCGTTDTREAANTALAHDYTGEVKKDGNGTHSFLCKNNCGTYGGTVSCSTWTPDGAYCKCTVCGYTKSHAWGAWQTVGGSATEKATQKHICNDCKAEETTECDYEVTVHKDATCEAAEITTYKCSECGHGYTEIGVGPKGHKFEGDAVNHGNGTHSFLCENNCGEYGIGTTKGAKEACSDWTYANTGVGKHTATCKVCSYVKTDDCSGGTATCTALAECQYCDTAYGALADHKYEGNTYYEGAELAKEATCTTQAEYYTYCSACKKSSKDTAEEATFKYGDLLAHTYIEGEYLYKATEAECEVNETYYTYCSACKASSEGTADEDTFEKDGTALVHKFNGAITCNNDGTHTILCSNTNTAGFVCDETVTANCADSAISFGFEPSTCTEQGYTNYQCGACNYTWKDNYTAPLGHDYTKKIRTNDYLEAAANCEHENIYWYACSRCNRSAEEITADEVYTGVTNDGGEVVLTYRNGEIREHSFTATRTDEAYLKTPATCFAAAKYYNSCEYDDCKKSAKDVLGENTNKVFSSGSSLGHNWVHPADEDLDAYIATPATCTADGTYYYVCSRSDVCGCTTSKGVTDETWTKENSKSGHAMTHKEAKAADCYSAGNYEYWYCSTCKKFFKDANGDEAYASESATVIKKREHDIVDVEFKAATCEEDGNPAYKYCKHEGCGYETLDESQLDKYKAIGHNFTGALTCDTIHNYHSNLCANGCGKSGMVVDGNQVEYKSTYNVETMEYDFEGGEACTFTYKAVTDKTTGEHRHENGCVCGNSAVIIYEDSKTFVNKVEPTCTADGYENHKCPDCNATWKKNVVKTDGHKFTENFISNGDGTHSKVCTVDGCGYKTGTAKCSGGTATCKDKAVCEVCNAAYGETSDHTFTAEWVYQNDAKCGINGNEKNTCSVCNTEVTREAKGTALDHEMTEHGYDITGWTNKPADFNESIKAPTCKEEGLSISYCKKCDYYETEIQGKDANAHDWEKDETSEDGLKWTTDGGDCATGVTYKNKCTVCDKVQIKTEAGAHKWTVKLFVNPTCTDYGFRIWKCSVCDFTMDEYYKEDVAEEAKNLLPDGSEYPEDPENPGEKYSRDDLYYADHAYGEAVEIPATCTSNALSVETCKVCGEEKVTEIENTMADHDLVDYKAVAATCETAGHSAYQKCKVCNTEIGKVTEAAKGHGKIGEDGKCEDCNRLVYDDEGIKSCGCICHKENFLMRIIYKIINFFWKLFKISKTCNCGAVHW